METFKKEININVILLTLLSIVSGYFTYLSIKEVGDIEKSSALLREVQSDNLNVSDFRKVLKANSGYIEELNTFFIGSGEQNIVSYIENMERLAKNLDFEISAVSQKDTPDKGIEILQTSINLSGRFDDILVFIEKLENLTFGIKIVGASISYNEIKGVWESLLVIDTFKLI